MKHDMEKIREAYASLERTATGNMVVRDAIDELEVLRAEVAKKDAETRGAVLKAIEMAAWMQTPRAEIDAIIKEVLGDAP